ncbi:MULTISPECIES: hypothetical protein [Nocardioides]|uniref:Uncharacterized protein n=1 Tax=Nocardioides vastitatis TaxID=2568655 RepID=A0ABW0ZQW4_9ACTN|nr:hypothetical protein [Nocardioides sp.]THJ06233.1 hypothetical protein E7Z54_06360 [Nocardioides sp.]
MRLGELVHDGQRAAIVNQRAITTPLPRAGGSVGGYGEPYDFARDDAAVMFWGLGFELPVNGEMFELDLATGATRRLYRDRPHNETHLFPGERFGLEESNRAFGHASGTRRQWTLRRSETGRRALRSLRRRTRRFQPSA